MAAVVSTRADLPVTNSSDTQSDRSTIPSEVSGKLAAASEMAASIETQPILSFSPSFVTDRKNTTPTSRFVPGTTGGLDFGPGMLGSINPQAASVHKTYDPAYGRPGPNVRITHMVREGGGLSSSQIPNRTGDMQNASDTEPEDLHTGAEKGSLYTAYDPTLVKHRRRTTAAQLEILDAHFAESPKPDMDTRRFLSKQLDMTVREVQVWFQNRRAKQKKIDSRAQKAGGQTLSPSPISPVFLSAPPQLSASSYGSGDSFSQYSAQSVPSYDAPSGYSTAYTPSSVNSGYSGFQGPRQHEQNQAHYEQGYGSNIPYSSSTVPPANYDYYTPYQQVSYFPDVRPEYGQASYASKSGDEKMYPMPAFSATNNGPTFTGSNIHDPPLRSLALEGLSASVSVSPASSKSSSYDETAHIPRKRSGIPPALSNLSGLSIMPYPSQETSNESVYSPSGPSAAPSLPTMSGMPAVPVYGTKGEFGVTYYDDIANGLPPVLSPTAVNFPARAPNEMVPSTLPTFTEGVAGYQAFPQQASPHSGLGQPITLQPGAPFGALPSTVSLADPASILQMNATIAARRQSLHAYPDSNDYPGFQQFQQNKHDNTRSQPKGFSLLDDSVVPSRRASTSVLNSHVPMTEHHVTRPARSPLDPSRQADLDNAAQAVLPNLASPPIRTDSYIYPASNPLVSHKFERGAATSSSSSSSNSTTAHAAFEDIHILGGLRRGSIAKKAKSPTSTYSPYPPVHPRYSPTVQNNLKQ